MRMPPTPRGGSVKTGAYPRTPGLSATSAYSLPPGTRHPSPWEPFGATSPPPAGGGRGNSSPGDRPPRFRDFGSGFGAKKRPSWGEQVGVSVRIRCLVVPEVGIEPTRDYSRQILSLVRLPIPPLRHWVENGLTITVAEGIFNGCRRDFAGWSEASIDAPAGFLSVRH